MMYQGQRVKISAEVVKTADAKGAKMVSVLIDGRDNPIWVSADAVESDEDDRK